MENGGTLLNKETKNRGLAKVKVGIRTELADIVKQVSKTMDMTQEATITGLKKIIAQDPEINPMNG